MSIPPNQFRRDHPWTRFVLLDSSAGPSRHKQSNPLINVILKKRKNKSNTCRRICFSTCVGFVFSFFKDNVNEWVTFACDGRALLMSPKGRKRVQGWSRLNWLGGILIIVSWHIHFNKLLMPLTPVCCFAN